MNYIRELIEISVNDNLIAWSAIVLLLGIILYFMSFFTARKTKKIHQEAITMTISTQPFIADESDNMNTHYSTIADDMIEKKIVQPRLEILEQEIAESIVENVIEQVTPVQEVQVIEEEQPIIGIPEPLFVEPMIENFVEQQTPIQEVQITEEEQPIKEEETALPQDEVVIEEVIKVSEEKPANTITVQEELVSEVIVEDIQPVVTAQIVESTPIDYPYSFIVDKVIPLKGAVIEASKIATKQYKFVFLDPKGEVFCESGIYVSKISCLKAVDGIATLINKGNFIIQEFSHTKYRFLMKNDAGKVIIHSIDYKNRKACENSISDLIRYIKHIEVKDLT